MPQAVKLASDQYPDPSGRSDVLQALDEMERSSRKAVRMKHNSWVQLAGSLDMAAAGQALFEHAPGHNTKALGASLTALGAAGVLYSGRSMLAADITARRMYQEINEAPSTRYFKSFGVDLAKAVDNCIQYATTTGAIAFGQNACALLMTTVSQTIPSTPLKLAYAAVGVILLKHTIGLGRNQLRRAKKDKDIAFGGARDIICGYMPDGGEQYLRETLLPRDQSASQLRNN